MAQSSESWCTETTFDRLLWSVWRKQLLITTSWQICYIWNTKENICLKLMKSCTTAAPEASSRASRSYCRSVCIHRRFRPISSFTSIIRMCDRMSPVVGWNWTSVSNCKCKVSPPLISTALHLPLSSAAIERVFSNFGLVQSKLWNHFGLEKAAKLVTCYRQLCGNAELNWIGNWNEHWNGPGQTMKYLDASLEFRVLYQLWLS